MLSRARGSAVPGSGKSVGVPLPSFFGDGFLEVDPADVENVEKGQAEGTDSVPVPKVDVARSGPLTPQVLKQGFLHKAGRHGQIIWRGRWFVLESDVLCYYSSEKDVSEGKKPKPKGVISLHGSFVQKGKDPTRFRLLTPKRTYAFRADSVQEAQSWMDELSGGSPVRPALSDADDAEADQQIDDDEPDDDDESRMFSEKDVEVEESVTVPRNVTWRELGHATCDTTSSPPNTSAGSPQTAPSRNSNSAPPARLPGASLKIVRSGNKQGAQQPSPRDHANADTSGLAEFVPDEYEGSPGPRHYRAPSSGKLASAKMMQSSSIGDDSGSTSQLPTADG